MSIYLSIFIYLYIYLCVYPSIHLCMSIHPFICQSVCLSVCLSISIYMSIYLFIYLSVSIHLWRLFDLTRMLCVFQICGSMVVASDEIPGPARKRPRLSLKSTYRKHGDVQLAPSGDHRRDTPHDIRKE